MATVEPKWITRARSAVEAGTTEIGRMLKHPRAPLIALALILLYSAGARVFRLGEPCSHPCTRGTDHTLIFDEAYYVNAARVIAGINPPKGASYHNAPLGKDPERRAPAACEADHGRRHQAVRRRPLGLAPRQRAVRPDRDRRHVRARASGRGRTLAGGGRGRRDGARQPGIPVHGRVATLDIYAVALMLVAAVVYLRRWHLWAGVVLGLAMCTKEVAVYLVAVLVLLEIGRALRARFLDSAPPRAWLRANLRPLAICLGAGAASLLLGLWILDLAVPAYDTGTHITYGGSPFTHISHIYTYALKLKAVPHATGISSSPWDWLLNEKPIDYARVAVNSVAGGNVTAKPGAGGVPRRDEPVHHLPRDSRAGGGSVSRRSARRTRSRCWEWRGSRAPSSRSSWNTTSPTGSRTCTTC